MENYWMFYADRSGYIPMGKDGQKEVPFRVVRDLGKLERLAAKWLGERHGRIYLMASWTSQMSELGPRAFEEYIMKYGVVIASN